jgi:DNA repair protein RadC
MAKPTHLPDSLGRFDASMPSPAARRQQCRVWQDVGSVCGADCWRQAPSLPAPPPEVREIKGLGEAGIATLKTIQAAALRLMRAAVIDRPLIISSQKLMEYLTAVLAREKVEHFRLLYLDRRNRLIADEPPGKGHRQPDPGVPAETRAVSLELNVTAMILVRNHPSRDPTPSQ